MVSGGTTYSSTLENEKGHTVDCHASGFGLISTLIAKNSYEKCINRAKQSSFTGE